MIETVIEYEHEFTTNDDGEVVRQWRDEIRSPQDIWDEIVAAGAHARPDQRAEAAADRDAHRHAADRASAPRWG